MSWSFLKEKLKHIDNVMIHILQEHITILRNKNYEKLQVRNFACL